MVLGVLPVLGVAQGPFYVNCDQPVRYANPTVTLNFDPGDLKLPDYPNSKANSIVFTAMEYWNNASGATITLQQGKDLSSDITVSNYKNLVFPQSGGTSDHTSLHDGLTPVIYDIDGSIIDDMLGSGAHNTTLGFATSVFFDDSSNFIPGSGYVVINGNTTITTVTQTILQNAIAHELGHMIGLDHSQAGTTYCTAVSDNYPLMYPIANCRISGNLHADDQASVASLYPSSNVSSTYGEISGYFKYINDVPIKGANIYAQDITGTAELSYSSVSDYMKQNTGYFKMYLPAGTYSLHSNRIDPSFTDSSRIGPYSSPNQSVPETAFSSDIVVSSGYSTHVTFYSNGTGSVLPGKAMDYTQNVMCPRTSSGNRSSGGGSGGGSLSWLLLLSLCLSLCYRIASKRRKLYKDINR